MSEIIARIKRRITSLYNNISIDEISGSLGDLGTLLPLLVALSAQRSIALAPALFFGGVANLITGFTWDVPMCVQPMKSIAAVALSEGWKEGRVTAAGIWMGILVLILGATSLIEVVNKIVPSNVVSGLQIGVGIRLASKGIQMVAVLGWFDGYDCIFLGVLCALLCMYWLGEKITATSMIMNEESSRTDEVNESNSEHGLDSSGGTTEQRSEMNNLRPSGRTSIIERMRFRANCKNEGNNPRKHPVGVYLFLIGVIFATITLATTKNEDDKYDLPLRFFGAPIAIWAMDDVSADDWKYGFLEGAIPQLPLTTLNSVISVCALAHSLYPEKRNTGADARCNDAVISRKEVAISVGLMNLIFCPFGSMPNCHGAGGLAGQHRLGARHGSSVVFLGLAKMCLAIFFGASALTLLDAFPNAVLGVMLAIAGQELATTGFTLLVRSVEDVVERDRELLELNSSELAKKKSKLLRQNTVISTITAMVIISLGKTHFGALSGFVAHMIYGDGLDQLKLWYGRNRRRNESNAIQTSCMPLVVQENDSSDREDTVENSSV